MILGLKHWADKSKYYDQTNNGIESVLGKLESCGPESAVMLMDIQGKYIDTITHGGYCPQPADILSLYFHDYRYKNRAIKSQFQNEYLSEYPQALKAVFGYASSCKDSELAEENIINCMSKNQGIMFHTINPGHYSALVAYDTDKKEVIYNDPWPRNPWPSSLQGTPGFNRRLPIKILQENLKRGYLVIN